MPGGRADIILSPRPAAQGTCGYMTSEIAPRQLLLGELSLEPRHTNCLSELHSMPPSRKTRSEPQSRTTRTGSSETARTRSGKKPGGSFRQEGVQRLKRKFRSTHSGFVGDAKVLLLQGTGENPGAYVSAWRSCSNRRKQGDDVGCLSPRSPIRRSFRPAVRSAGNARRRRSGGLDRRGRARAGPPTRRGVGSG